MATWAIGDVHGCHRTLVALFDRLPFARRSDHLWMVGDLVNRGPSSLAVLRWARGLSAELGERMVVVLGNHDVHLLALAAGRGRPSHRRYLDEVLEAPDRDELLAWLRSRPLVHRGQIAAGPEHLLVHAGLPPAWTAAEAMARGRRAEELLRSPAGLERLLEEGPDDDEALEEARETLRAVTTLRMLTPEGAASDHTGPPEKGPKGAVAWFDRPDRRSRDHVVVTGHWAALGRRLRPDLVALDSGCVYGGALTAVRLEDRRVLEQPNRES